jgi:GT2 family glycosyltransferase
MNQPWRLSILIVCDHYTVEDDDAPVDGVLRGLASQTTDLRGHEIVIVDGTGTEEIAKRVAALDPLPDSLGSVRVIPVSQCGRATAANVGIRQATGDLLVLLAADFIPEPQLVEEHVRFHESQRAEGAIALGPGVFPAHLPKNAFAAWLERTGRLFGVSFTDPAGPASTSFFYSANASLKKAFVERVGGFDETFPYNCVEDYELGQRLLRHGGWVTYLPRARASHEHDLPLAVRRASMWQAGLSAVRFAARYPDRPLLYEECGRRPEIYRLRAHFWHMVHLLSRSRAAQERYWQNTLSQALAQGYRAGRRAG